jgi:tripeptidyl-peptidase-1
MTITPRLPLLLLVAAAFAVDAVSAAKLQLRLHSAAGDAAIEAEFAARSTPDDALYRQHLDVAQLARLVGAPSAAIGAATAELQRVGATDIALSRTRDYITCRASSAAARALFQLDAHAELERAADAGRRAQNCQPRGPHKAVLRGGVPAPLAAAVAAVFVLPAAAQPGKKAAARLREVTFEGGDQNPDTIRARYGYKNVHDYSGAKNFSQVVAEFEQVQFYQADVDDFNAKFKTPNVTIRVNGPNNGGFFGEGVLDVDYVTAVSGGAPTWWVAEQAIDYVQLTNSILEISPLPSVVSISWGGGESQYEQVHRAADNAEFKKLGLLGMSLFAAAGDQATGSTGSWGRCGTFDPTWPAVSPYITAVGGTYSATAASEEVSWTLSGGGFSAYFPRPGWQSAAVAKYLANATGLPAAKYYNATGRGIPDVAALSTNFAVLSQNFWGRLTGTSAATPTFAAIISRIAADRMGKGLSKLGFLNPALYKLGKVGYDVVSGANKNPSCPQGFPARAGWDAVSGLGTPQFDFLSKNL